jgi:RNA polymerase sigma-70 factor (ECF subfamily)
MAGPALIAAEVERLFRTESRRVFASLVRLLRDFDLAEESLQEAYSAALISWPVDGIPENPRAWLVSAGRYKAIDRLRRQGRLQQSLADVNQRQNDITSANLRKSEREIEDDRLRLIFTCCHPAIDPAVQVPLTLREVCRLTTDEIARAFLVPTATMAQRIVRGKAKIRDAGMPIEMPAPPEFAERLQSVLTVVYLVFNEGYAASAGDELIRADLSAEAIRLGRLLAEMLPDPEVQGLLALMLLTEARRAARTTPQGDLVLLEDQDRTRWDRELIAEGESLCQRAIASRQFGEYTIQASIAAVHAQAATAAATDWRQIDALYGALLGINSSPIVELNQAVAAAMHGGPAVGLARIDAILERGDLRDYHLAHAARADMLRRLGRNAEAQVAYEVALSLSRLAPERRFLERRIAALDAQ